MNYESFQQIMIHFFLLFYLFLSLEIIHGITPIDTFIYKIQFVPSYTTVPGFSYYSLLRFGVGIETKRTMIELMMELPIQRILNEKKITHLPPWSCYLVLSSSPMISSVYTIMYVKDI